MFAFGFAANELGDAKVENLDGRSTDRVLVHDHDVFGFQVAVYDAGVMGRREAVEDLIEPGGGEGGGGLGCFDDAAQGLPRTNSMTR